MFSNLPTTVVESSILALPYVCNLELLSLSMVHDSSLDVFVHSFAFVLLKLFVYSVIFGSYQVLLRKRHLFLYYYLSISFCVYYV